MNEETYEKCRDLLHLLTNEEMQNMWSWPFMEPVPKEVPDYYTIIKKPMDLGSIKKRMGSRFSRCRYSSHEKFARDVRLVFQNALLYNQADANVKGSVYDAAQYLLDLFEKEYARAALPPTTSSASASPYGTPSATPGGKEDDNESRRGANDGGMTPLSLPAGPAGMAASPQPDPSKAKSASSSASAPRRPSSVVGESGKKPSKPKSKRDEETGDTGAGQTAVKEQRPPSGGASGKMDKATIDACTDIINKLEKHKVGREFAAASFMAPVDITIYQDYPKKIKRPIDLKTVKRKLRKGLYSSRDEFADDVRQIFANCLEYNCDPTLGNIRDYALSLLAQFEKQYEKIGGSFPGIPERWEAQKVIDIILRHRTLAETEKGEEEGQAAFIFCFPFETYYGDGSDAEIKKYYSKIKKPMYIGQVQQNLHMGRYKSVEEFKADMNLVFDNCITYWSKKPDGAVYSDLAKTLKDLFQNSLNILSTKSKAKKEKREKIQPSGSQISELAIEQAAEKKSNKATTEEPKKAAAKKRASVIPGRLSEEDRKACLSILSRLRKHKMTVPSGIEVYTAQPFLTSVDVTIYKDYLSIVAEPMDLKKMEKKVKGGGYRSLEEFRADLHLIVENCLKYNADPVQCADIRAMALKLNEYFERLMQRYQETGSVESTSGPSEGHKAEKPSAVSKKEKDRDRGAGELSRAFGSKSAVAPALEASSEEATQPPESTSREEKEKKEKKKRHKKEKKKKHKREKKEKRRSRDSGDEELDHLTKRERPRSDDDAYQRESFDSVSSHVKEEPSHSDEEPQSPPSFVTKPSFSAGPVPRPVPRPIPRSPGKGAVGPGDLTSLSLPPPAPPPMAVAPLPPSQIKGPKKKTRPGQSSEIIRSLGREYNEYEAACERALKRIMKHEWVSKYYLNKPVLEVHPELRIPYLSKISKPMDFGTMMSNLQKGYYQTFPGRFVSDGKLVLENAIQFNTGDDEFSTRIREVCTHLLEYWNSICLETIPEYGSPEEVEALREAKKADREKRESIVRPASMKHKQKECSRLMKSLLSQKYAIVSGPFREPVAELFPQILDDYFQMVERPMDLRTINEKLNVDKLADPDDPIGGYNTYGEFEDDIRLTFENALRYNVRDKAFVEKHMASCQNTTNYRPYDQPCCGCGNDRTVYGSAQELLSIFNELWAEMTVEIAEKIGMEKVEKEHLQRLQKIQKEEHEKREAEELERRRAEYEKRLAEQRKEEEEYEKELKEKQKQMFSESSREFKVARERQLKLNKTRKKLRKAENQQRNIAYRKRVEDAFAEAVREAEVRSRQYAAKLKRKQAQEETEKRRQEQLQRKEKAAANAMKQLNVNLWENVLQKRLGTANNPNQAFWNVKKRRLLEAPTRKLFGDGMVVED